MISVARTPNLKGAHCMSSTNQYAWPLVVILAFTVGALWHVGNAQDVTHKTIQKWEYYYVSGLTKENLKQAGDEGWELVAAATDPQGGRILYFKRPK
jgi:hypothetical protein